MHRRSNVDDLTLVVLAAGLSRRFGRSKTLEPLGPCGETLPQYTVYDAMRAGIRRAVFVVHPEGGARVRDHLATRLPEGMEALFVPQSAGSAAHRRARPWGTGAAVLAARCAVDGPFVVANGDDLYGAAAVEIAARHLLAPGPVRARTHAIVGFRLRETLSSAGGVSRAVCRASASGLLLDLEEVLDIRDQRGAIGGHAAGSGERRTLSGDALVSMNLWAFFPEMLSLLERPFDRFRAAQSESADAEYLLGEAVHSFVDAGSAAVRVLACDSTWHGITHRADRDPLVRALERMVEEGHYPSPLPGHR